MNAIVAVTALLLGGVVPKMNIWGPRSLKSYYADRNLEYNIASFGVVPYGRTIYGTVVKAHPLDACTPLADFALDPESPGPAIALVERGSCHFAQKVLNAQLAGAVLVLIGDSITESVDQVILYEGNEELVKKITIPSLLVSKREAENFLNVLNSPTPTEPITLAVDFVLTARRSTSRMKLFLQIDSAASFEALTAASAYSKALGEQMQLLLFYRLYDSAPTDADHTVVCRKGKTRFCITQDSPVPQEGLSEETVRHLCLLHTSPKDFTAFGREFRRGCFDGQGAPVSDLAQCSASTMKSLLHASTVQQVDSCLEGPKADVVIENNLDSTRWDVLDISPLIYINDFLYKGNGGDFENVMSAFCSSFEHMPAACELANRFDSYSALRAVPLSRFVFLTLLLATLGVGLCVSLFYFVYHRRIKATYDSELSTRVARAISKYVSRGGDSYAEFKQSV